MKEALFSAILLVGCTSATSNGGTLAPGQVTPGEDDVARAPTPLPPSPAVDASAPGSGDTPAGCPERRNDEPMTDLASVADLRASLTGIYRACIGNTGIELRIDPSSDTRLLWYGLDERFVRQTTGGQTGFIDIQSCEGSTCTIEWHLDAPGQTYEPIRTMKVWSEPIAVRIETNDHNSPSWFEWVRVAK